MLQNKSVQILQSFIAEKHQMFNFPVILNQTNLKVSQNITFDFGNCICYFIEIGS